MRRSLPAPVSECVLVKERRLSLVFVLFLLAMVVDDAVNL